MIILLEYRNLFNWLLINDYCEAWFTWFLLLRFVILPILADWVDRYVSRFANIIRSSIICFIYTNRIHIKTTVLQNLTFIQECTERGSVWGVCPPPFTNTLLFFPTEWSQYAPAFITSLFLLLVYHYFIIVTLHLL